MKTTNIIGSVSPDAGERNADWPKRACEPLDYEVYFRVEATLAGAGDWNAATDKSFDSEAGALAYIKALRWPSKWICRIVRCELRTFAVRVVERDK
jgi:hypothetical protein